jgi:flotillin
MSARADSYRRYSQAALVEMFVKMLPEIARAISEPLSKVEKIVMVGNGSDVGVSKLTGQVAAAVAQVPAVVESLTGINLNRLIEGFVERNSKQIEGGTPEIENK